MFRGIHHTLLAYRNLWLNPLIFQETDFFFLAEETEKNEIFFLHIPNPQCPANHTQKT